MAEDRHEGPLELGAEMDYPAHEQTYTMFLALAKWGTLSIVALLIAMAFGFFTSAGFISALILFLLVNIIGIVLLK